VVKEASVPSNEIIETPVATLIAAIEMPIQTANNEKEQTEINKQSKGIYQAEKVEQSVKSKQSAKKVRFGINIAQGINSTSTASASNYSGGVNIDIPLWGKLEISTGMQIEQQNVVSKSSDGLAAIPSDIKRASLLNFDFPLNIKWKIFSRKTGSYYISGGISSLAYLSEKYTTTSQRQELRETAMAVGEGEAKTYKLENVETTTSITPNVSSPFDIAGRLNISIGYEKQISPALYLHIEPFLKIPVSGLANENLRFVTSGITFKLSF